MNIGIAANMFARISDLAKFLAVMLGVERVAMILSYACGLSHEEEGMVHGKV